MHKIHTKRRPFFLFTLSGTVIIGLASLVWFFMQHDTAFTETNRISPYIGTDESFTMPTVPASGVLPIPTPNTTSLAQGQVIDPQLTTLTLPGQHSVQLRTVIYTSGNPNILVTGDVRPKLKIIQVWIRIRVLSGTESGFSWTYPVPVKNNHLFSAVLHVPFSSGTYCVAAAPPLQSSQTSLSYTFATRTQSISPPFMLHYSGEDSNRQLGMLTSVWANWTDPRIARLARSIVRGSNTPFDRAQAVYRWEAMHISYAGSLLLHGGYSWSTTEETLARGEGICVDYANVADALLRALHIPSQMVVGYARDQGESVADNGNTAHAWNRALVSGKWIYFDPTWSREYFLSPGDLYPEPSDLYLYQPQWFNPSPGILASTHSMDGILDQ